MPKKSELAAWREAFTPLIHPLLPPIGSLLELEDKLDAALGFLHGLEEGNSDDVRRGTTVAKMACHYATTILDHFGLADGDDAPFEPRRLSEAKTVLTNLLASVRQFVKEKQLEKRKSKDGSEDDKNNIVVVPTDEPKTQDEAETEAEQEDDNPPDMLIINEATYTVQLGNKSCQPTGKRFDVLKRLVRTPGQYVAVTNLIDDVWQDEEAEEQAVQRMISNLRKDLTKAGITELTIDGNSRSKHYMVKFKGDPLSKKQLKIIPAS